jgi:DnaJ-class molecular chaperone
MILPERHHKPNRKEQTAYLKATHKLLCPQCEGKSTRQLMMDNMGVIPMLVKTKCSTCGFEGMFVEVPLN